MGSQTFNVELPLISVIIPCFNQGRYLPASVGSALAQTYPFVEIIVVNDGSTDQTEAVCAGFGSQIRYFRQDNRGLSSARNRGLIEMRGDLVQFLDADDVIFATKLEQQVKCFDRSRGLSVSICDYFHGEGENLLSVASCAKLDWRLNVREPFLDLIRRWESDLCIPPFCFLFDARIFREHNIRFDEELPNHEDWDCWIRIFAVPATVHLIDQCLGIYRQNAQSMSQNLERMRDGYLAAIDRLIARGGNHSVAMHVLVERRRDIVKRYGRKIKVARQGWIVRSTLRLARSVSTRWNATLAKWRSAGLTA